MIEYFKSNYKLTDNQTELVVKLDEFLNSDCPVFLIKGYAGTGKTFMMKGLTDFLSHKKRSFIISAPTGRAAKVIAQKTNQKACTIHRRVYSYDNLKEFKIENKDGTETFKFYYDLRVNQDPNNSIYIIDEASMLSDMYSEGEFFRFGSGFLLQDLMKYINIDNNDHNKKIIFIGDNAQLPPVNMSFSPALDRDYIRKNCNLESRDFELTEVVRQKSNSGILHNATKLREALKANVFNKIAIETNFINVNKTIHEELLKKYLKVCNNTIDDETIIVAYSNSLVKEYNDSVRKHFFPNKNIITEGDKVILVSNNYNYHQMELLNGDFGLVKEVSQVNESRTVKLKKKNKENKMDEINVILTFRDVKITFIDEEFKECNIECKIIENVLYSGNRDLESDELKAIYIDFKIRNPKLKAGTEEFKDAIRNDVYFNALHIKFGYAITCHKAQGGEWKNTFLNCETSMGYFNSSYFRWLYTGITRTKQNLFIINEPYFTIGSNLQPPKIRNIESRQDIIILNRDVLEREIPFDYSNEKPFKKHIFHAISECLKDKNITISKIRHTNYLEHYTLSQGKEQVVFKIYYNGQKKITKIDKPVNATPLAESIYSILIHLCNMTIIIAEEKLIQNETEFEFEHGFLKEFYGEIRNKVASSNIRVSKIEHKPYHEIYEFTKGGLMATYKFWYDGKSRFKKTEIIQSRTTGITEEINKSL